MATKPNDDAFLTPTKWIMCVVATKRYIQFDLKHGFAEMHFYSFILVIWVKIIMVCIFLLLMFSFLAATFVTKSLHTFLSDHKINQIPP